MSPWLGARPLQQPSLIKSTISTRALAVSPTPEVTPHSPCTQLHISERMCVRGEGQETGTAVNLMEGLAGNPIKSTHGSMLGNVLPPSLLNEWGQGGEGLTKCPHFLVSPYPGDGKPTHRFSGAWSPDSDTVPFPEPPLASMAAERPWEPRC